MEGIYSNGGHNSSFLLTSASSVFLRQVIEDKKKSRVSQEPDPFLDNTQLCFLAGQQMTDWQGEAERKRINRGNTLNKWTKFKEIQGEM